MRTEDAIILAKAGFTRDQIIAMAQVAQGSVPAPTQQPVPAPTQQPVPAPTQQPVPAPTQQPVPAPTQQPVPAPTQQSSPMTYGDFHKEMQNMALLFSGSMRAPETETETTDDILASIINPPIKE